MSKYLASKLGLSVIAGISVSCLLLYRTYQNYRESKIPFMPQDNNEIPFICKFYNQTGYRLLITNGVVFPGQQLNPPIGTHIDNNNHYDYCLFETIDINTLAEDGTIIQTSHIVIRKDGGGNNYLLDLNNNLIFTYDAGHSYYPSSDPWKQLHAMDITAPKIKQGPPVISNQWESGMGNNDTKAVAKESFWVQDYGMNEKNRWTTNGTAVCQDTQLIGTNVGSRAYPIYLATGLPTWKVLNSPPFAPGTAFSGCWQIEIKCGSTGTGDFCETFYLAERANLNPGPEYYQDGSGHASGGNSREIDIMETKWKPMGPQTNCPTGGNTGWTNNWNSQQMANWDDIGGLPMKDFVTFGCLIAKETLWFYAYKPDGSQWYASEAIPLDNSEYQQKNPFVPYIGTWSGYHHPGGFKTGYLNFIYLSENDPKISGKNPKDDPAAFGGSLVN